MICAMVVMGILLAISLPIAIGGVIVTGRLRWELAHQRAGYQRMLQQQMAGDQSPELLEFKARLAKMAKERQNQKEDDDVWYP